MPSSADSNLALKLWTVLVRAHAAVEAHAFADIDRHGLTPGEFGALETLYHKGPLLIGELRRRALKSSGGMSFVLDKLEGRGLVERRPVEGDGRARLVALTPEGERLVAGIFPEHQRVIEYACAALGREEKEVAIRLLRALGHGAAAREVRAGAPA